MSKLAHSNQETMNKIESQSCKYQDIEDIVVAVIDSNVESVAFKETVGHCAREIIAAIYAHSETDAQPVPVEPDLGWLYTHCKAIGMDCKSDSGKMAEDIALFTINLQSALQRAQDELDKVISPCCQEWHTCQRLCSPLAENWRMAAKRAEATNRRMVELMKEPSDGFKQWFLSQIPSGTVISNPEWWIPRIHKAMSAELLKEVGNG